MGTPASTTSQDDIDELRNLVDGFYRNPGIRISWEKSPFAKPLLDAKFVKFVDDILATDPGSKEAT